MEVQPRHVSVLVAYRTSADGQFEIFMQQRGLQAPRFPGRIGFFGGGIEEGETPEQALEREIQEELCISVPDARFFNRYEVPGFVLNVFTLPVEAGFETTVRVMEGEGGIFINEKDIAAHTHMIPHDQTILKEVIAGLHTK